MLTELKNSSNFKIFPQNVALISRLIVSEKTNFTDDGRSQAELKMEDLKEDTVITFRLPRFFFDYFLFP